MTRNSRYDPMFASIQLGPVTAPNRFYQVPHCSGMGYHRPQMMAVMRGVKAEGGWGVVCTEYCSIHASSDESPYPSASLSDADALWIALDGRRSELEQKGFLSPQRIGDCRAPGIIAAAVYAGHKVACELGCLQNEFKRDRVVV